MQYFLGIDGGGTKSRLIIGDNNSKNLFIGQGDSINIFSVGAKKSLEALKALIDTSLSKQNINVKDVKRICIASAGLARESELKIFKDFFQKNYPTMETIFTTDIKALLVGALNYNDGICLISGTGSVAMGQDKFGNIVRAGGFGWRLGDEGSASNIALEAIRRIIRSSENRDLETNMSDELLNFFNLKKIEDTIKFFHDPNLDKASVASAAYIVTKYAREKDPLATDILQKSATELFNLVLSVHNRLPNVNSRSLITAGGVFEHDEVVTQFFNSEVQKYNQTKKNESGVLKQSPLKTNALDGALYIAINKL